MVKTGLLQKRHRAIAVMELEQISEEFAGAMKSASHGYVAATGHMTGRMAEIWARYVIWSQRYEKDFV